MRKYYLGALIAFVLSTFPVLADKIPHDEVVLMANEVANKYSIDAELLIRILYVETCADPLAVGRAGEKGIAQLMPYNYKRFNVKDPFDAIQNMEGAALYIQELQSYTQHPLVLAAMYNFGPKARKTPANQLPLVTKNYLRKLVNFKQTLQSCGVSE